MHTIQEETTDVIGDIAKDGKETPVHTKRVVNYPTPSSMAQRVKARTTNVERKQIEITPQLKTT